MTPRTLRAGHANRRAPNACDRAERGAAAVELTLLAPLLIVLLLFVVLVGRLAASQLDVNAAAHAAARAASLQRDPVAAVSQARKVAETSLAGRGLTCRSVDVAVDTGGLRPGGAVTVTVTCHVGLDDLSLLRLPGSRAVTATSSEPIDTWRAAATATAVGGHRYRVTTWGPQ